MINDPVGKPALVIGDSRTGKTFACDAYRLKYAPKQPNGDAPIVPVIYWHATTETGQRELFVGLLEHLKYRITKGTIALIAGSRVPLTQNLPSGDDYSG